MTRYVGNAMDPNKSRLQVISIGPFPGLENFVPAVAYPFCLNLSAAFSQPGNGLIEIPRWVIPQSNIVAAGLTLRTLLRVGIPIIS